MLRELHFGALLAYPAKGLADPKAEAARDFVLRGLKQNQRSRQSGLTGSEALAEVLATRLPNDDPLLAFIGSDPMLVPVPRRGLRIEGGLWPSLEIARAMVSAGFGASCVPLLERRHAVPKSAFADSPVARPTPKIHYDSLRVRNTLEAPARLLLVDDPVSRGATLLACATRLGERYPSVPIRAFAAARTLREFPRMIHPIIGVIRGAEDGCRRDP